MELSEEIKNAARELGKSLHEDEALHAYRNAVEELLADPEARELEEELYRIKSEFTARQLTGEQIGREETQNFQRLRRKVLGHPLIFKREDELRLIKPLLADLANEISGSLGIDYTILARPG